MSKEKKIIMYDSPEAAEPITLSGWTSKGEDGRFFYREEHDARWRGCTHKVCECGKPMEKSYTKCKDCREKAALERYMNLPFKEYDGSYVCERDGERCFWSEDDIIDYLGDLEEDSIDLLFCDPIDYSLIDSETVAGEAHENYEPPKELEEKIKEFNAFIRTLPPHSWMPGKVRTTYKISTL